VNAHAEGRREAAHINMWTSMMLDFEGANAVLFCRAEGNPPPTITWFDPDMSNFGLCRHNNGSVCVSITWFDPADQHITSSSGHNQYLASTAAAVD